MAGTGDLPHASGLRRKRRGGLLRAGLLLAAGAALLGTGATGSAASTRRHCPPSGCGGGSPPTAPTVVFGSAQPTGYTTATVSGTINPGGATTTYEFVYQPGPSGDEPPAAYTPQQTLAAGNSPQTVQASLTGLYPGAHYQVGLIAWNSAGNVNDWSQTGFVTPQAPTLSQGRLSPRSMTITNIGEPDVYFHVLIGGEFDPFAPVDLYVEPAPYRTWHLSNDRVLPGPGGWTSVPVCQPSDEGICQWLDRNFKVKVIDGPAASFVLSEYVQPQLSLDVTREQQGYSPWLDVTLSAVVHYLRGRHHFERVFFYHGPSRRGPFRLVASARFRVFVNQAPGALSFGDLGTATLWARARFREPAAGVTLACIRHRILPDMGKPFLARWCGRARLP